MKEKVKIVYYCDYCKKKYFIKSACAKHEKHCTRNLNRICGICGNTNISDIIEKIKEEFPFEEHEGWVKWKDKELTQEILLDYVEGCPACALTIIRIAFKDLVSWINFNYKEAHTKYWNERNAEKNYYPENY